MAFAWFFVRIRGDYRDLWTSPASNRAQQTANNKAMIRERFHENACSAMIKSFHARSLWAADSTGRRNRLMKSFSWGLVV